MTDDEYIEMCAEKAREEARDTLKFHVKPYEWVKAQFVPHNMSVKEFERIVEQMETDSRGRKQIILPSK